MCLLVLTLVTIAQAQIQTAGTLFINMDATAVAPGLQNDITNSGYLGGCFEGNAATTVAAVDGVNAVVFGSTNYLRLLDGIGGALIPPPPGLVGTNAICSIEVWALNPAVAADECMVSWGGRSAGLNMAFEYGTGSSGGVQHQTPDMPWDAAAGGGAPQSANWHHLVYTCDGANQNLYADGVLVNSAAVAFRTMTNAGIALGAQWNSTGTAIGTTPGYATLALARVRVHDGALTPEQVLNNYDFEKAAFTFAPAYLTAGPVHRYSFNETATNNASGLAFNDSVGAAHGAVQGSAWTVAPRFTGRRLVLPGGFDTALADFGQAYADLPNGLLSANSANNGGSGEMSLEIWYRNTAGTAWNNSRVFDIGSLGPASPAEGVEVTGPGGYPSGNNGLDMLFYSQIGTSVNQRRLGWLNKDTLPSGTTTNAETVNSDGCMLGGYQTERHLVVTWKESTGQVIAYENGLRMATSVLANSLAALNDVNVWLGRANNSGNSGFAGEYDEVRVYNFVLSPAQVLGNYQVGPETINTAAQEVRIATQPQSATANENWPVSFFVKATGSPGVAYQWQRNSTPVPGATAASYSIAAASLADSGAAYTCVVSNYTGTPNVLTSSAAILTVLPNQMPPLQVLHETREANAATGSRNNQTSGIGGEFRTGTAAALVTHLGMYDVYGDGLIGAHEVGIFSAADSNLIAQVTVPAGPSPTAPESYLVDNYRYVALSAPLLLAPNTGYFLMAMVFNADGDLWADTWAPAQWNSYFTGSTGAGTRRNRWGANNSAWPPGVADWRANATYNNQMYGAPNLAVLPIGPAVVAMQQTSVTQYATLSVTLSAAIGGQAPLTLQWYKVGTPDVALAGQTAASLNFANVAVSDAGNYYVVVSNALAPAVQSDTVTLTVLADLPVSITQQPSSVSAAEGFEVGFAVSATGTPPVSYQWRRNGTPIPGATASAYTIAAASMTNNGDSYSCVLSNYANAAPHSATSASATLTVLRNVSPTMQTLYPTVVGSRDNFNGSVGGLFRVGETSALVTHLGYYCLNGYLNSPHHVALWPEAGGDVPLASVFVSGSGTVLTNGYAWEPLDPPLLLEANTAYVVAAEVYSGSGDPWPDSFVPSSWNAYFVGGAAANTRANRYGSGVYWPTAPTGSSTANAIFGAGNLAVMPIGPAVVRMARASVSEYQGFSATLCGLVAGEAPVTVQWYKSPGTLLAGQTNTTLTFTSLGLGDSGNYHLRASNRFGTSQSEDVTLTVLAPVAPSITQAPQPVSVYVHQPASFSVTASGTPPLAYQWSFAGTPIPGATGSSLILYGVTGVEAGDYTVTVTNAQGADSASAALTVLTPPAGSYAATVLELQPLVYYRFSDVTDGSTAFNLGSLGVFNNGTYRGAYTNTPGPQPPDFVSFEPENEALQTDGTTVDVLVPALNLDTNTGPNATLAAWIRADGLQTHSAGIIFHRGVGGATGMQIKNNNPAGDHLLGYHWANEKWDFNSGLIVPTNNTWTFVAVVVEPDRGTLYLNDGTGMLTDTNFGTHLPGVPLSSAVYVGWDTQTSTRRVRGGIDEAMIFDRALSPAEISLLYETPAWLEATRAGGDIILTWSRGTLQQADTVNGNYTDLTGVTSPYTNTPGGLQKYFRVRVR